MNNGEEVKVIEALREEVEELRMELETVHEVNNVLELKLKAKEAESEEWRLKYEGLTKRNKGKSMVRNDKIKTSIDTLNPSNDTITRRNETLSSSIDTIDSRNDTMKPSIVTINSCNGTMKLNNDTMKPSNDTLNSSNKIINLSNDTIVHSNETINPNIDTIKLMDSPKTAQKEEMIKKVKVRMHEIVAKKHKEGKIIDRKVERLAGVLTMLAEEGIKIKRAELVAQFGSTASTMHREMKILKKAGLVRFRGSRKSGTFVLTEAGKEFVGMD